MHAEKNFTELIRALKTIFADEGRAGGDEAAAALSDVLADPQTLPPANRVDVVDHAAMALKASDHAAAPAVLSALPLIDWHYSGLADGRIRPEIALLMATSELIGPNGMLFHPSVRVGLFMQAPNLNYVTRIHLAEETFVMLGGNGYWTCNGSEPERKEAGAYIFHPSNAPHTSITRDEPLIAAWRWTGDIAYEGYSLQG